MRGLSRPNAQRIGAKIGLTGLSDKSAGEIAKRIGSAMSNNKLATGLVAIEVYDLVQAGDPDGRAVQEELQNQGVDIAEVVAELRADDDLSGVFEQLSFSEDTPADSDSDQTSSGGLALTEYAEEIQLLDAVVARHGTLERFLQARNAYNLSNHTILVYQQFRSLAGW